MPIIERWIEIESPVDIVFDLLSDFESYPEWMQEIRSVRQLDKRVARWTGDLPSGHFIQWETETVIFEPDHRIAWRSLGGDLETSAEIILEEINDDTTLVRLIIGFDVYNSHPQAREFFGNRPGDSIKENLRRLKQFVERQSDRYRRHYDEVRSGSQPEMGRMNRPAIFERQERYMPVAGRERDREGRERESTRASHLLERSSGRRLLEERGRFADDNGEASQNNNRRYFSRGVDRLAQDPSSKKWR
jgi:uncharacterized protein YndB with AHSA1/START domain